MVTGFFVLLTLAQLTLGGVFFASPDNTGKILRISSIAEDY